METELEKKPLKEILLPLKETNSTDEFIKLWQKLFDSARDMDVFYEECKSATFRFREMFDEIRQTEQLNNALRYVYYDALSTKKKHEGDRDSYFNCDKRLAELKDSFVSESQNLALKNSKYVEYSLRFATRREELFSQFLSEFGRICEENHSLKQDKWRLAKEQAENRTELRDLKSKVADLEFSSRATNEKCKSTEEQRDHLKKEAEWEKRQTTKLKESIQRIEKALSSAKAEIETLKKDQKTQEADEVFLKQQISQLTTRCQQLEQLNKCNAERISQLQEEAHFEAEARKEEKCELSEKLKQAQLKLETARENNHKTMLKNQQLRENLSTTSQKLEKVTKEKLRCVLKENRTQHNNSELASHQLLLINEILELKSDYFRDQVQIREGGKLNRKLKVDVQLLEDKVKRLKENSLKIDPLLDGAAEYRKHLLRRYSAKKVEVLQ